MTNAPTQALTDHMQVLFGAGTCAGMTDGELLDRFMAGRNEAGDLAFDVLTTRHGPMVMRVCRNVLDDPHDVHDAFQAVFLVLARRAHSIRHRESVGSWLYGVAVRVTARARVAAIRRQIRDRRTLGAAQAVVSDVANQHHQSPAERNDQAEVVHQELSRLPEKYRAPVVLCYLEGLTHDEAAARLNWPVGTVRSRLARARDRLRDGLTRRGVAAPTVVGPMANWISGEIPASTASAATFSSMVISRELVTSTARAVSQLPVGRTVAMTAAPTASFVLAQGVLRMMTLKKLMIAACTLLPIAITTLGGTAFLARKSEARGQNSPAPAASSKVPQTNLDEPRKADEIDRLTPRLLEAARKVPQTNPKEAPRAGEIDRLAQQLLEAARKRFVAQRAYYEEGRITIDRFVDACKQLELAELRVAASDNDRLLVRRRHLDLIGEIEQREKADLEVGRGTVADLAEAHERRLEAELDLKLSEHQAGEMAALLRRLSDLELKVERLQKERAVQ